MVTVSVADVDMSLQFALQQQQQLQQLQFSDSNLLEKCTSFNLEKSYANYYFAKYIYLLVTGVELVAFQNL